MNKIWIFVEGFSEVNFIINLFRNTLFESHTLKNTPIELVNEQDLSLVYCYLWNCGDVEKIPHEINDYYNLIEKSDCDKILIICDVEDLGCLSKRKERIESILSDKVDKRMICYTFSNPMLETDYWECPQVIRQVLNKYYRDKYDVPLPEVNLDLYKRSKNGLVKLFKDNGLNFRKRPFSEQYFGRITNFRDCEFDSVSRVIGILST